MEIIEAKNYKELSKKAAEIISKQIKDNPRSNICLATGETPKQAYTLLVKEKLDFSQTNFFNLDEYYPIKENDKRSFSHFLHKNLLDKINTNPSKIHLIGQKPKEYENRLKKNKIDLTILGIGRNGHVAFNEPDSEKNSKTRIITLTEETRKANKIKFNKAITQGIKNILSSKKLLLLASGKQKAQAIKSMLKTKPSNQCPASFLTSHKNITLIADREALRLIR